MIESVSPVASRYSWVRVTVVILVVFLLGFGLGAGGVMLGMRYVVQRELTAPTQQGGAEPIDQFMQRLEIHLNNALKLGPKERKMVHEEFVIDKAQFKRQRNDYFHALRVTLGDSVYRLASRLPPDKGAKLKDIVKKRFEPWGIVPGDSPSPSATPVVTGT
jgi:hypothetical protein